ncbi:MAG: DUF6470 family protein [Bacillaceae bacterium]|nr:DUF6470 family protein [Bacillaceae bacterium]
MNMPRIDITTTRGEIGRQSDRSPMQIRQRPADLQIQQQHTDNLQISKRATKLLIDQTAAFADANLKGPMKRVEESAQKGKQKVMGYIQKKVQEGDQMMKIENGNGAIAQISASNSQLQTYNFNYGAIPKPLSVKFNYDPGETNITINQDTINVQVNKNAPQITIPKWQSNAYLKQKNSITFQAVGTQINRGL